MDFNNISFPFFKENLGVYYIIYPKGTTNIAGIKIKHPATIFHVLINIDASATKDTPIENNICKAIIALYLKFPNINYFKKL